jgi:hypothetical protein
MHALYRQQAPQCNGKSGTSVRYGLMFLPRPRRAKGHCLSSLFAAAASSSSAHSTASQASWSSTKGANFVGSFLPPTIVATKLAFAAGHGESREVSAGSRPRQPPCVIPLQRNVLTDRCSSKQQEHLLTFRRIAIEPRRSNIESLHVSKTLVYLSWPVARRMIVQPCVGRRELSAWASTWC